MSRNTACSSVHDDNVLSFSSDFRLDDCCRPVLLELWAIFNMRISFVTETVHQMENSHRAAVAEMTAFASAIFPIGADGLARSKNSGKVVSANHEAAHFYHLEYCCCTSFHSTYEFQWERGEGGIHSGTVLIRLCGSLVHRQRSLPRGFLQTILACRRPRRWRSVMPTWYTQPWDSRSPLCCLQPSLRSCAPSRVVQWA